MRGGENEFDFHLPAFFFPVTGDCPYKSKYYFWQKEPYAN